MNDLKQKSLKYHESDPPGKITIQSSKPCSTQDDLALAYSPGVAFPCLEIQKNPEAIYRYTSKGNTVGVITDGTAVLGLGNIGPAASLPVMEGKCVLLRKFAGINGVPIAIRSVPSPDEFVQNAARLEENFGAINLEDIKAPECFEIEQKLSNEVKIPVFHDDQHGTAIIVLAALMNSLEIVNKKLTESVIVINGAGAAGIACARFLHSAGVPKLNIFLSDSSGAVYKGRTGGMNMYKEEFAQDTDKRSLVDLLTGADVFIGVSKGNVLSAEMIHTMNAKPIIFALANPEPEIMPDAARSFGASIVATGRSDFPNQVNNVLGFPGIFRGVLDCRASRITTGMKLAASYALASLAKEHIPLTIIEEYKEVYPQDSNAGLFLNANSLGTEYILPKPFDPRVVPRLAKAVVQAAQEEGVSLKWIDNPEAYERELLARVKS